MYSSGHGQGHNTRPNGGPPNRGGMPILNYNNHQNPPGHHNQYGHQHQDQHAIGSGLGSGAGVGAGGGGGGMGHHASYSNGLINNPSPYAQNNLPNGHSGNTRGGQAHQITESWAQQLRLHKESQAAHNTMVDGHSPHYFARMKASENKGVTGIAASVSLSTIPSNDGHNQVDNDDVESDDHGARRPWRLQSAPQSWHNMDMSGQALRNLAPALFNYDFLRELYIASNKISRLPDAIGRLRQLTILDASHNQLTELPAEIGMCTFLKELKVFDNHIRKLPNELGSLFNLVELGIEGNPLDQDQKMEIMERGTKSLVTSLREHAPVPLPPNDRVVIPVSTSGKSGSSEGEHVKVLSWNILCEKYATTQVYGYTPSDALAWDYRKTAIIQDIRSAGSDVVCLQEVSGDAMRDVLNPDLAREGYKGVHFPRSKAKLMDVRDSGAVDGCAVFWNASKYILLDKQVIDFAGIAINRQDMKNQHDIFNRVMPKDNIGMVCFLESRYTGARFIIVNAHLAWEPTLSDVKLIQTAILMGEVKKHAEKYTRWPACKDKRYFQMPSEDGVDAAPLPDPAPSQEYHSFSEIPIMISGDFNSTKDSSVYELLSTGKVTGDHSDFGGRSYGEFTKKGIDHPFNLRSSYQSLVGTSEEMSFTNYTPGFIGFIDYIWFSTSTLEVVSLLGPPDMQYLKKVPGFPNYHFPADHIQIMAEFAIKPRKR